MFKVDDLYAETDCKPILKGFSLTVNVSEVHSIMAPNGADLALYTAQGRR